MKIFFDTSAFFALEVAKDVRHQSAKRFYQTLNREDFLATSDYVVDETITRFQYRIGYTKAVEFAETMLHSRLFPILRVDEEIERAALSLLKKYKDKKLSFTDCTTMVFLRDHGFDAVFAFDDDFKKAGFRVVPEL